MALLSQQTVNRYIVYYKERRTACIGIAAPLVRNGCTGQIGISAPLGRNLQSDGRSICIDMIVEVNCGLFRDMEFL